MNRRDAVTEGKLQAKWGRDGGLQNPWRAICDGRNDHFLAALRIKAAARACTDIVVGWWTAAFSLPWKRALPGLSRQRWL